MWPLTSPRTWDTGAQGWSQGWVWGPHQYGLTRTSWKQDRVRNVRAAGGEPAWGSASRAGLSCKDPNSLGQLLLPGGSRAAGSQPAELRERLGIPGKEESCGVEARPESGLPGEGEERTRRPNTWGIQCQG